VTERQLALRAAELSEGSVERALQLADPALWSFRDQLTSALAVSPIESVRLGRAVQAFVDEAGKESSQRRERLRIIIGFAVEFHRSKLRIDQPHEADLQALDACLTALEQIDRNANLGLVIQHWCEELNGFSGGIAGQNRSPALTSVSRV
jgi:hypothetical protein